MYDLSALLLRAANPLADLPQCETFLSRAGHCFFSRRSTCHYDRSGTSGPANHCKEDETKCTNVMAGFDLSPVPSDPTKLQYKKYNFKLLAWFNGALQNFATDFSKAELQRHFPWSGTPVIWETLLYPQAVTNPFLGHFADTQVAGANGPDCDVTVNGPTTSNCFSTAIVRGSSYLYPRQCRLADLASGNVDRLRKCGLNYELHHNGYLDQWPQSFWGDIRNAGMIANQYGRTSFYGCSPIMPAQILSPAVCCTSPSAQPPSRRACALR